jgi:hypothetical protein
MNLKKSLVSKVLAVTFLTSVGSVSTAHAEIPADYSVSARIEAESFVQQQNTTTDVAVNKKFTGCTFDGVDGNLSGTGASTTLRGNWLEYDNVDLTGIAAINFMTSDKSTSLATISVYASDTTVTGTSGSPLPSEATLLGTYSIPMSATSTVFTSGILNFQQSVSGMKNIYLVYNSQNGGYLDYFELLKGSQTQSMTTKIEGESFVGQQNNETLNSNSIATIIPSNKLVSPTFDGASGSISGAGAATTLRSNWMEYDGMDLTGVTAIKFCTSDKSTNLATVSVYASDATVKGTNGNPLPSEVILLGTYSIPQSTSSTDFISGTLNLEQSVSGVKNIYLVYNGQNGGYLDYFELLKDTQTPSVSTNGEAVITEAE